MMSGEPLAHRAHSNYAEAMPPAWRRSLRCFSLLRKGEAFPLIMAAKPRGPLPTQHLKACGTRPQAGLPDPRMLLSLDAQLNAKAKRERPRSLCSHDISI